jgi:hypothetical protein
MHGTARAVMRVRWGEGRVGCFHQLDFGDGGSLKIDEVLLDHGGFLGPCR